MMKAIDLGSLGVDMIVTVNCRMSGEAGAGKSVVLASIRMIYSGGNRK